MFVLYALSKESKLGLAVQNASSCLISSSGGVSGRKASDDWHALNPFP
jgi:hypothetical protein